MNFILNVIKFRWLCVKTLRQPLHGEVLRHDISEFSRLGAFEAFVYIRDIALYWHMQMPLNGTIDT